MNRYKMRDQIRVLKQKETAMNDFRRFQTEEYVQRVKMKPKIVKKVIHLPSPTPRTDQISSSNTKAQINKSPNKKNSGCKGCGRKFKKK
jgi:hypothetical protein